ncbi:MAG: hypothetical protein EOO99_06175 [Pedobacter sp.]|nr:MAG: hypothetical protein EOO99_06175 [Pedobacter sp.]
MILPVLFLLGVIAIVAYAIWDIMHTEFKHHRRRQDFIVLVSGVPLLGSLIYFFIKSDHIKPASFNPYKYK